MKTIYIFMVLLQNGTDMNKKLNMLYVNNINALNNYREKHSDNNLHGPLLLKLKNYFHQHIKLMVIGQETYGWCNSPDINEQLETYEEFDFGVSYHSSPFWNIIRKVERALSIEPYAIAWSNLNRFDVDCGSPDYTELARDISSLDYILKEEINILTPDICIFFTNHKYDHRLTSLYEDLIFENINGLPEKHFVRLYHPDLPEHTIRAPHPKTIRIKGWENDFIKYIEAIK